MKIKEMSYKGITFWLEKLNKDYYCYCYMNGSFVPTFIREDKSEVIEEMQFMIDKLEKINNE